MLFWLKKFISFWLMPLSFTVAMIAAGLWLMRSPKRARLGRGLAIAGVVLLAVFSNKFTSRLLIRPLETRYPAIPELANVHAANVPATPLPAALARCRFVVVLGGGNGHSANVSANNLLSGSTLGRIVEAVRLLRALPDAKLIVSGPGTAPRPTHARVLARTAQIFGIAPERIVLIEQARDTEEEARAITQLVGEAPVALVTSAWHMPRAMALCRHAAINALPCPADFLSHDDRDIHFQDFFWEAHALDVSSLAVRERIGYFWLWLRGKT